MNKNLKKEVKLSLLTGGGMCMLKIARRIQHKLLELKWLQQIYTMYKVIYILYV